MTVPPVTPDPLSVGLRAGADTRPADGSFVTRAEMAKLREVEQSDWYRAHLAQGHVCHAFKIEDGTPVCLDCGSAA